MTTAQVVETSVTNNSLSKDYPHPDDHAKEITDSPGFKPFTMLFLLFMLVLLVYIQSCLSFQCRAIKELISSEERAKKIIKGVVLKGGTKELDRLFKVFTTCGVPKDNLANFFCGLKVNEEISFKKSRCVSVRISV